VNSKHSVRHRLVVIGHAAGAVAWMYSTKFFPFQIPYLAIILVEPELIDRDTFFHKSISERGDYDGQLRRSTKEDCFLYFNKYTLRNTLDARALGIYMDQCLCMEPLEGQSLGHVILKCDKVREGTGYQDGAISDATDQIAKVCNNVPIHVIYGEANDCVLREQQVKPVDRSKGRTVASVIRIPGPGQIKPDALAQVLSNLFDVFLDNSTRVRL